MNYDYDHSYHIYGETDPETGCLTSFITLCLMVLLLIVCFLLTSCTTTRVVEREVIKTDTVYHDRWQHDSIFRHDSIFVHEYMKGDTVYRDRDRWHTEWRERIVRDTAYVSRTDTVRVTKTQQVAKPLSGWQWFQIWAGRLALILLALAVGFAAVRLVTRRIF